MEHEIKDPRVGLRSRFDRIFRGGAWNFVDAVELLSTHRLWAQPSYRDNFIGFRCARTP